MFCSDELVRNPSLILLFGLCLLSPGLRAQGEELQRAILLEEKERDLEAAAQAYRKVAAKEGITKAERTLAWYRLGRVLERLGKQAEARGVYAKAEAGEGPMAAAAKQRLGELGSGQDAQLRRVREQARELLQQPDVGNKAQRDQLMWLGAAAVPVLIEVWGPKWEKGRADFAWFLWTQGGAEARAYLERVLQAGGEDLAEVMVSACVGSPSVAKDLADLVPRFARKASINPDYREGIIERWPGLLSDEDLLQIFAAGQPDLPSAVLTAFSGSRSPDRWAKFVPLVQKGLSSDEEYTREVARKIVLGHSYRSRELLLFTLSELASWPRTSQFAVRGGAAFKDWQPPLPAAALLAAAEGLGSYDPTDQRAQFLRWMVGYAALRWQQDSLAPVLRLVDLGYFPLTRLDGSTVPWSSWMGEHVSFDRGDEVLLGLKTAEARRRAVRMRCTINLGAASWPVLRALWPEDILREDQGFLSDLADRMGSTGHPEALSFAAELRQRGGKHFGLAVDLLYNFARLHNGPALHHALEAAARQSLASKADQRHAWELIQVLSNCEGARYAHLLAALPGESLGRLRLIGSGKHFDRERVAATWRYLLTKDPRYWAAEEIRLSGGALPAHLPQPRREQVFRAAYGTALELGLQRLRAAEQGGDALPEEIVGFLSAALARNPAESGLGTGAFEAQRWEVFRLFFTGADEKRRKHALSCLHQVTPPATPEARAMVLACARSEQSAVASHALILMRTRYQLTEAEFNEILRGAPDRLRVYMLSEFLSEWSGRPELELLIKLLADKRVPVRIAACRQLGRRVDPGAINPLLRTLQDADQKVRDAAREALAAIRFYHEQKRHWQDAAEPPLVSPNRAAEELVAEAAAGKPKAGRLFAIRGLGLLGKVEVLPHLIRFSREKDPEIAAAAREALERLTAAGKSGK